MIKIKKNARIWSRENRERLIAATIQTALRKSSKKTVEGGKWKNWILKGEHLEYFCEQFGFNYSLGFYQKIRNSVKNIRFYRREQAKKIER